MEDKGGGRKAEGGRPQAEPPASGPSPAPLPPSAGYPLGGPPPSALDPTIQERLVAYLDGELDAAESRRVEELLANDPRVRAALQGLDRTWEALGRIGYAPGPRWLHADDAGDGCRGGGQGRRGRAAERPRRRRRGRLLAVAGLAAAGLAGFLTVLALLPDANRQLLRDLPLLENLDQYREIDTEAPGGGMKFLKLLEKLFPGRGRWRRRGGGIAGRPPRADQGHDSR